MNTIINPSDITATTLDGVKEQVLEIGNKYNTMVEDRDDLVNDAIWAMGIEFDDYSSREVQRFSVDGETHGDWQSTITVVIFENYVDAGSDDYVYSFTAYED